jgi:hypothetical protein
VVAVLGLAAAASSTRVVVVLGLAAAAASSTRVVGTGRAVLLLVVVESPLMGQPRAANSSSVGGRPHQMSTCSSRHRADTW